MGAHAQQWLHGERSASKNYALREWGRIVRHVNDIRWPSSYCPTFGPGPLE